MKIRNGFVSNSSSSSFLIYGAYFEGYELTDLFMAKMQNNAEILATYTKNKLLNGYEDGEEDNYEMCEIITESLGEKWSSYIPFDEGIYIGKSWSAVGDDETGSQFKKEIEDKLHKNFGDDIKVETHEYAWSDG